MKVLIGILDGLVHFRPEWSDEQGKHFKLSKLLISEKIPLDPALPNPIDAFPLASCMPTLRIGQRQQPIRSSAKFVLG
jgi:hypothetical protein